MGDWLLNAAKHLLLEKASLDVLKVKFNPTHLNIQPLLLNAHDLKEIIGKELMRNSFPQDFIKEAFIDFEFPSLENHQTKFYCSAYLVDKDGKKYESGRIMEEGLEPAFNPFQESHTDLTSKKNGILSKIKNFLGS